MHADSITILYNNFFFLVDINAVVKAQCSFRRISFMYLNLMNRKCDKTNALGATGSAIATVDFNFLNCIFTFSLSHIYIKCLDVRQLHASSNDFSIHLNFVVIIIVFNAS